MEAGWSQRDLAAKMKVSPAAVGQWETAQTLPSIANRADLSRLLKIPFIELVPELAPQGLAAVRDPLIFAIVQQVQKLPISVQEAFLVQISAMVEALQSGKSPER